MSQNEREQAQKNLEVAQALELRLKKEAEQARKDAVEAKEKFIGEWNNAYPANKLDKSDNEDVIQTAFNTHLQAHPLADPLASNDYNYDEFKAAEARAKAAQAKVTEAQAKVTEAQAKVTEAQAKVTALNAPSMKATVGDKEKPKPEKDLGGRLQKELSKKQKELEAHEKKHPGEVHGPEDADKLFDMARNWAQGVKIKHDINKLNYWQTKLKDPSLSNEQKASLHKDVNKYFSDQEKSEQRRQLGAQLGSYAGPLGSIIGESLAKPIGGLYDLWSGLTGIAKKLFTSKEPEDKELEKEQEQEQSKKKKEERSNPPGDGIEMNVLNRQENDQDNDREAGNRNSRV